MYHWDEISKVPYLTTSNNEYISFDDTTSVWLKGEYVVDNNFGGVIIWELSLGVLNVGTEEESQPLLESIYSSMGGDVEVKKQNFIQKVSLSIYPNPFSPVTTINFNSQVKNSSI